jgi:hypothetical protein
LTYGLPLFNPFILSVVQIPASQRISAGENRAGRWCGIKDMTGSDNPAEVDCA